MTDKTYAQRFAGELGDLIEAASKTRDMLDVYTTAISRDHSDEPLSHGAAWDAARELDAALEPFEESKQPDPVEEPESGCKGFQWIGQSWEHCNRCSRPAWEHEGCEEMGADSPFSDGETKIFAWTGMLAEVRQKYLKGVRITVQNTKDGGQAIVYSKE